MKKLIAIIGPTSCGKTDLAKKLIQKYNGEVISADSRQIFKFMDIGTGKDKSFFQHMIDVRKPDQDYSVAEYQKEVYKIIDDIFSRDKVPFLVGGSMMYIDAVLYGYQFPKTNQKIREKLDKLSNKQIYNQLRKVDLISAEKNKQNHRRLIRALEVYLLNSRPQSEYKRKKPGFEYLIIGIDLPREELYHRIDERVDERIKQGMITEVENLLKIGINYQRLQDFGLEYRYISEYLKVQSLKLKAITQNLPTGQAGSKLDTKKDKQVMIQKLKYKIHAFARRQLTWWRKNKEIHWTKSSNEVEELIKNYLINL